VARSDFEKVQSDLIASQSQLQTSQSDYTKLKSERDSLQSDYDTLKSQHDKLQSEHDKLQSDFDALTKEKQALEEELKATEAKQSTAELGKNSAEVSLKDLQEKVDKARIKAEILNLIFSQVSKILFGGTTLTTRAETVDLGIQLQRLIAEANDPTLDEKFTAMINDPNDKKISLDFFVYLVSDLYENLK
jgi:chromosome segregation ATPase